MTENFRPDYEKFLSPLVEVTTSVEALLEGAFGPLMGDQRESLKRIYSSAWGLHTLFMDIITSLGIENVACRTYLEEKFDSVIDPLTENCRTLFEGVDGPLTEEQAVCIEYVLETSTMLRRYVDTLWLYSRVLHKKIPVASQTFFLQHTLRKEDWSLPNDAVSLELALPEDLPPVHGDPQAVTIALQQVVNNALQFTPQGHVRVAAYHENNQLVILIEDTGCGIVPEHTQHIFEPFFQSNPGNDGLGLGLSIACTLIEQQRGQLSLQRSGSDGSIFALTLPTSEHDS